MKRVVNIDGWSGGVNNRLPPDQIDDVEVTSALNFELDRRSNWVTRRGTENVSSSTALPGVMSSLYYFETSEGTNAVFGSSGSTIRKWDGTSSWAEVAIDAGASFSSLPSGAVWRWASFQDSLIGVSGAIGVGVASVVMIDDIDSPTLKDLSSDPQQPRASHIAVLNSRVFVVDPQQPNRLVACKLGDAKSADSWSDTGIAGFYSVNVGGDEGGRIVAIHAYRGVLVVFKRRSIYIVSFGSPNTDTSQWEVVQVISNVGLVSPASIQQIVGDLVFLSDDGLLSFTALRSSDGDVSTAILSENINDLQGLDASGEFPSAVLPSESQYWISIPRSDSGSTNSVVWVMDYSQRTVNGRIAWFSFDGAVAGASYTTVVSGSGDTRLLIGSSTTGTPRVSRLHDESSCRESPIVDNQGSECFADEDDGFESYVVTKSFDFGEPLQRKLFYRFGMDLEAETDPATYVVSYTLDDNASLTRTYQGTFAANVEGGSLWNDGMWDSAVFADENVPNTTFWRTIADSSDPESGTGRKAKSIQFRIATSSVYESLRIKTVSVEVELLDRRRVEG